MFLDIVIGKIWRAVKGIISLLIFISGSLIAGGVECSLDVLTLQLIIGVILILGSVFIVADIGGMGKALDRLHEENNRLENSIDDLEDEVNSFKVMNEKREGQLKRAKENIERRDEQISESQRQLEELDKTNLTLETTVSKFKDEITSLNSEIIHHRENNLNQEKIIQDLEEQVFAFSIENGNLKQTSEEMRETQTALKKELEKTTQNNKKLEGLVAKQKLIQDNANKLIQSLMSAGDDFKDFKSVINESLDRIDNTADMLEVLATKMESDKFSELDKDGDGVVTAEEFNEWIQRQEQ